MQFEQIHFENWTNTFSNLDKYIKGLKTQINSPKQPPPDKSPPTLHIVQFEQIYLEIWTNVITLSFWEKKHFTIYKIQIDSPTQPHPERSTSTLALSYNACIQHIHKYENVFFEGNLLPLSKIYVAKFQFILRLYLIVKRCQNAPNAHTTSCPKRNCHIFPKIGGEAGLGPFKI